MIDNFGNQIYPGSVDNGKTDTEYTPTGYERTMLYPPKSKGICAADERHADHEARIAALETQVHRLLNSEPAHPPNTPSSGPRTLTEEYLQGYTDGLAAASHVPEADYAHIPIAVATWEAICDELEAARAADVPMLRRMIDGQHKVASERIEEIVRLSSELRDLRAKWEAVPWQALLWSVSGAASVYAAPAEDINTALDWIRAEAPKEATE